ncbi:ATP-binding protein [Streptomyces roseirectus]|uniref:ATP-binding protein n=1 Tax=Streptomyces roseirectus TaxID=2768066 RepID=A0A7H0IF73_9ACTN|nr:ATP-binding protein [Streptomyces roseirectus]QNP71439.1 ATP-binding protein [Streptomyces roseirectus]
MTDSCPIPTHFDSITYTPTPRTIPLARRHVTGLLTRWGHPDAALTAALLTSELCTNAILHGKLPGRLYRVETSLVARTLRIAVTDPKGESVPAAEPHVPAPDTTSGRGLLIVQRLASRWSVEKLTVGKTVWAELDL